MDGIQGVSPPDWVITLLYGEKWDIPPWEVEEAPAIWIERQALFDHLRETMKKDDG